MRTTVLVSLLALLIVLVVGTLLAQPSVREQLVDLAPPPLGMLKPVWKEAYRVRMLNLLAGEESSYLVNCYECDVESCRTQFDASLRECFRERDAEIPFLVLTKGEELGRTLGGCAEERFAETAGSLKPSPACDDALQQLYKTVGKEQDPRVFSKFLDRNESLKAVFEANPGILRELQQAIAAYHKRDLAGFMQIKRRLERPLFSKAFLESADQETIVVFFEEALRIAGSSQCAKLLELGQSMKKGQISESELKSAAAGIGKGTVDSDALKAKLIRSLKNPLPNPYTVAQLETLAEPALATLPAEVLAMEGGADELRQACGLMTAIALKYPSWSPEWREYVARLMGANMWGANT